MNVLQGSLTSLSGAWNPSFMNVRSSDKRCGNTSARASDLGVAFRRAKWRTTTDSHEIKSGDPSATSNDAWRQQNHWSHQYKVLLVYIQPALHCVWRKSHKRIVAHVHVTDQHLHLTCLWHIPLTGQCVWILPDHPNRSVSECSIVSVSGA